MNKIKYSLIFIVLLLTSCSKTPSPVSITQNENIHHEESVIKPEIIEQDVEIFKCWVNTSDGLKVREKPSVDSLRLGVIENGIELSVVDMNDQIVEIDDKYGQWLKIRHNDSSGWVFGGYVSIIPPNFSLVDDLPITLENIVGDWFYASNSESNYDYFMGIEESYGSLILSENGTFSSGISHTGMGVSGTFTIENDQLIETYEYLDDESNEDSIKQAVSYETIVKLNRTNLVLVSDKETRVYQRFPAELIAIKDKSIQEWVSYINSYGNEICLNDISILMYSLYANKLEIAFMLINSNINTNKLDNFDRLPLYYLSFCLQNKNVLFMCKALMKEISDPNYPDITRKTTLDSILTAKETENKNELVNYMREQNMLTFKELRKQHIDSANKLAF